ncbi:aspartate 1-decarboxylase [Listeria fleischmannii]|uniref:Aspartate 1-decarboxylase n=1 Tax=Listeria fleischmannii TaxID=1069827 RepID=A0A841YD79_9LIST|nr:aspartate 1-decarboxylase [Listeria fleischmannii]EIA21174.1 aspartate alpha-decarboxylase [Listeria fleischmannii subsp. coloradonensis]MBC1398184.1 aspartate 1-decarboxylase [Listeria fleischmannii]MBC1426245.1 aspartate 1-decarboxylase [Listeria fleischmannii]STY35512.1 Aspartate 1-decarboxylase precursor [Listeria fleischmannii subsp. coloradonensis]
MIKTMMYAKIHRATVTEANLNYVGSITIDEELLEATGLLPNEKVQIVNNNNGERFETYIIAGTKKSGVICLNGAAARLVAPGDIVIIMGYAQIEAEEAKTLCPKVIVLDEKNQIAERLYEEKANTKL